MAWVTPTAVVTDDVITAAAWNQSTVDNPKFLYSPPRVRAYNSANLAISAATPAFLTFNSERYDTDTMHSTVTATGRITFTTAGWYDIGCGVEFDDAVAGSRRYVRIVANGSTTIAWEDNGGNGANAEWRAAISTQYFFNAGEYAEVEVMSTDGVDILASGAYSPEFWACWRANNP